MGKPRTRKSFNISSECLLVSPVICHIVLHSLQFDFNAVILSWWLDQGPQHWLHLNCLDTAYSIGGRISLTDTGEPCHGLDFGVWWSLCLPCYFMLAIPYKIWRNVVCQIWDYCVQITGDINAVSSITNVPQLS